MSDLFHVARQPLRDELRAAGWKETGGLLQGVPMWTRPDGKAVLSEEEALAVLKREKKEGERG